MCRGAKIFFWQFVRVSKGFSNKNVHFLFLFFFYVGKSKKENMKKWEGKFQKNAKKNSVFWVVVKKNGSFFVKLSFCRKIGKHYLCSEGKKTRIFVCNYLFLENVFFLWPFQVTKHYKNRGFSRHRGETQNGTFGCKSSILGRGPERGFTICDT